MATPNYMKRIAFLDGQVLHDFHLNTMQANISEAIKLKTTRERYDMLLLVSPYKYYFSEAFTDDSLRDPSSTAERNPLSFTVNADSWVTPLLQLPENTDELYILANMEEDPEYGSFVKFFYRHSTSSAWTEAGTDRAIYLSGAKKAVQIKAECRYTGTTRPTLYDFCLMWK
jgi:hypothetical protein